MPNIMRVEESTSAAHLRLGGVNIEESPWLECFKHYGRPHTFFYAKPPYWQTEGDDGRDADMPGQGDGAAPKSPLG